jgi:hypothetical protein
MPDVNLAVTIPEGTKQTKTVEAWTAQAGTTCIITFHEGENPGLYHASWAVDIPAYDPAIETLPQFGKRFLLALGIASVKAHGHKKKMDADKAAIDALVPAVNDVPDDVLI